MTLQTLHNGLDRAQLQQVVAALQSDRTKTQTAWRTRVQWQTGFQNQFQARTHAPVQVDEPAGLLGTDSGPNPAELLLGALGSCLSIGYALNATARGITIEAMNLELEGDIDLAVFTGLAQTGDPGYTGVRVTAQIKSDATPEQLQALHEHVLRTSPICSSIQQPVPVDVRVVALP